MALPSLDGIEHRPRASVRDGDYYLDTASDILYGPKDSQGY